MSAQVTDPLWFKVLLVIVQGAIGAAAALIGVFIARHSSKEERQQRLLERLHEPYVTAHRKLFSQLAELQQALGQAQKVSGASGSVAAAYDVLKEELIWLHPSVADSAVSILEALNQDEVDESTLTNVKKSIISCQKEIRTAVGIEEYAKLQKRITS